MRIQAAIVILLLATFALSSITMIQILPVKGAGTLLYVDPPVVTKTHSAVGTSFVVNITLENFANLAGFDIKLTWNGTIITCTGVDYSTTLDALWGASMWSVQIEQSGVGFYKLLAVALATSASNLGASALFRMTFHVDRSSTVPLQTPIHFDSVSLSDNGVPIPNPIIAVVTDGMYYMKGTQLYIDPPIVNKGYSDVGTSFVVNVTLENLANLAGFDIKLTWNGTIITCTGVDYSTTLDALWSASMWNAPIENSGVGFYKLLAVALATSASNLGASALFKMTFHVDESNTSPLQTPIHFEAVSLSDDSLPIPKSIVAEVTDGMYYMSAAPPKYYLTLATNPSGIDTPTGAGWYYAGTYASISAPQYWDIVPNSSRYRFNGWTVANMTEITNANSPSTTVSIDEAKTVTANYVIQYNITYSQTGVGSDFTGSLVVIGASSYKVGDLPASLWYDNDSTHSFAFQSPLIVGTGAKQYDWSSTNGLSTLQSGSITVTGSGSVTGNYVTHLHDVAVTNVVADRTWIFQGQSAHINVTVKNNGDFPENVTVTLYYNITASKIAVTQNITLLIGENKTLLLVWDTTSVPYCHNYTLTAVATIPADYTPVDNTLSDGKIKVRIMGDLDGNGVIDMKDIRRVAQAFGSYPGHPRWDPETDLNGDGLIDMKDVRLVAKNFGLNCSP